MTPPCFFETAWFFLVLGWRVGDPLDIVGDVSYTVGNKKTRGIGVRDFSLRRPRRVWPVWTFILSSEAGGEDIRQPGGKALRV